MFDVTKDDVAGLDDAQLRDLVGRLCEAELRRLGQPVTCVTYGGHQDAADGGLDARVEVAPGCPVAGFIPSAITGYQVKATDMTKSQIIREMAPGGTPRPILQELADRSGAYILVSSRSSLTDRALRDRRQAMRDALAGMANHEQLLVEFHDQQSMATQIRQFPGLVLWVLQQVGRRLAGWQPYDSWSQPGRDAAAEFLLDVAPRFETKRVDDQPIRLTTVQGIQRVRSALAQPGRAVRLVGLSGVGKTRFAEALFDNRIGEQALSTALVAYTNHEEHPEPSPEALARTLIAERRRAILVVDNCGPDLHRRLVDLCTSPDSTVSVLTIEFDVQVDEPERTDVLLMRGLPGPLVEGLIHQRFPTVSRVDAQTIAELADGNSRIALALAEASLQGRSISTLKANELFGRLFWQHGVEQPALHHAAKICSLVYSFDGVTLEEENSELSRLAALAGQTADELFRHIAFLERKHLVQRRGKWRAVLPHALANRLAGEALEEVPTARILQRLDSQPDDRLFKSFTHRLSFLDRHPKAREIVSEWLEPQGRFGDVCALDPEQWKMLGYIAPVAPDQTLAALERAGGAALAREWSLASAGEDLLRSLAYEPNVFERSCRLLIDMVVHAEEEGIRRNARLTVISLFPLFFSGTHAPIGARLSVAEGLLVSEEEPRRQLGLEFLQALLQSEHFTSHLSHSFGARTRDYGYWPESGEEISHWFRSVLLLIDRLSRQSGELRAALRTRLAERFQGLWIHTRVQEPLASLMRSLADGRFWREGWAACRRTLHDNGGRLKPEWLVPLQELDRVLRPTTLPDQVRAMALGEWDVGLDLDGFDDIIVEEGRSGRREREDEIVRRLGARLAGQPEALLELLPELMYGGHRIWALGQALASTAADPDQIWTALVEGYANSAATGRDARILCGFLEQTARQDRAVAHRLLEVTRSHPQLIPCYAQLHAAIGLDAQGVDQLLQVAEMGVLPADAFRYLALGRATDSVDEDSLRRLLLAVAELPGGVDAALHVLHMRLFSDQQEGRSFGPALKSCGLELLIRCDLAGRRHIDFYGVQEVASACLAGEGGQEGTVLLARHLRSTSSRFQSHSGDLVGLLAALLRLHPIAVLEAMFSGTEEEIHAANWLLDPVRDHHANPLAEVSTEVLLAWCAGAPIRRFPIAASLVSYSQRQEPDGPLRWTEVALSLILQSPDPEAVLLEIVDRFRPRGWSGSGVAIIESQGELLDLLPDLLPPTFATAIQGAKAALQRSIESMRRLEADMDRHRPEECFE